jgi:hypothetical protein
MSNVILQSQTDYEIYFSHQSDTRPFNRGGVKNIGFLAVKNKYPNDYKNITFIFNDVDTIPFANIFTYDTTPNVVKHYYGFTYALGGIVVIKGMDFEKLNGYPCYWGWGNEDNLLNNRCISQGINIDRSEFLAIGSPQILQLFDGIARLINKSDMARSMKDNGLDGLCTISNLEYTIDKLSSNPADNSFVIDDITRLFYINISNFKPLIPVDIDAYSTYDLRLPASAMYHPTKLDMVINNNTTDDTASINDWTIIPPNPPTPNKIYSKSLSSLQNMNNPNRQIMDIGGGGVQASVASLAKRPNNPIYQPSAIKNSFKKNMFFMYRRMVR